MPPEVRAVLRIARKQLADPTKPSERVLGADAIGELGPKGRSARRDLCKAMLDVSPKVRTAAADALKKVDREMAEAAIAIAVNLDIGVVQAIASQGAAAEPLTPLVLSLANRRSEGLAVCITTLSKIAPDDDAANKFVIQAISYGGPSLPKSNAHELVRLAAVTAIRGMSHGKLAIQPLMWVAKGDSATNRLAAIATLEAVHDETAAKAVVKFLESMRYDARPEVRKAVEAAVERIKKK